VAKIQNSFFEVMKGVLSYRVWADIAPLALGALASAPHLVKLLNGSRHDGGLIGEDARLEVAAAVPIHRLCLAFIARSSTVV